MSKKKEGLIKARVLVDCEAGKCNTIVEAEADQIDLWLKNGLVDTADESIAAAEAENNDVTE